MIPILIIWCITGMILQPGSKPMGRDLFLTTQTSPCSIKWTEGEIRLHGVMQLQMLQLVLRVPIRVCCIYNKMQMRSCNCHAFLCQEGMWMNKTPVEVIVMCMGSAIPMTTTAVPDYYCCFAAACWLHTCSTQCACNYECHQLYLYHSVTFNMAREVFKACPCCAAWRVVWHTRY